MRETLLTILFSNIKGKIAGLTSLGVDILSLILIIKAFTNLTVASAICVTACCLLIMAIFDRLCLRVIEETIENHRQNEKEL